MTKIIFRNVMTTKELICKEGEDVHIKGSVMITPGDNKITLRYCFPDDLKAYYIFDDGRREDIKLP